jgi:nicotinamidase-related amidase
MATISRLDKSLDRSHTALVLFDALHGYLHPADPDKRAFLERHGIVPNLQRLLAGARRAGLTVFYPWGAHAPGGTDTVARLTDTDMDLARSEGAAAPIKPRFHKDSRDSEIAAELAPVAGDVIVPKNRWNAFFQTNLEFALRVRGLDTIVLAGGSTDVGIAATAFAARDLDLGLVIVRDACFSMRGNNHDFFFDRVFPRMGRVMTVDQAVELMGMP